MGNTIAYNIATPIFSAKALLFCLIPALFLKQLAINIFGGQRHIIAGLLSVLTLFVVYLTIIKAIRLKTIGVRVFHIPLESVLILSLASALYWFILVLLPTGSSFTQRAVSGTYGAFYPLLIWSPVVLFRDLRDTDFVFKALITGACFVCSIGMVQWFIPENNLPWFLKNDDSVFLSQTLFDTLRVNGMIGTPIEFAFLMSILTTYFYEKMINDIRISSVVGFFIAFTGLSMAASRAFLMLTIISILFLSFRYKKVPIFVLISFLGLLTIYPGLWDYFYLPFIVKHSGYFESILSKLSGIQTAIEHFYMSPIIGSGVGYQLAPDFGDSSRKIITDGFWWAILMEAGLIAIIMSFSILAGIVKLINKQRKRLNPNNHLSKFHQRWGLIVIFIGVSGNFINSSLNNQLMNILFYLIIGTVISEINIIQKDVPTEKNT